jgi:hypothetical protein
MSRERSVSPPRSSNRTCGSPASGFPTGFVTGSRHDASPSQMSQSRHTKIAEHRFHAERSDASRGHLAAPDQKVTHAVIQMGLDRAVRDVVGSGAEVAAPSSQQAVQSAAHLRPGTGFNGTTTLSDSRVDRCQTASLRPLPSPATGLPRLRDPLSRRAVPLTPMDRSRCVCRLLPQTVLPSPYSGRVGVHDFPFEACSGFTHVTARRFARPPLAAFVTGLRHGRLPIRTA